MKRKARRGGHGREEDLIRSKGDLIRAPTMMPPKSICLGFVLKYLKKK
jgi:hypothetical protein